ncbi:D-alanyl-D-alanine carboxypeptidase [Clostridium sp. SHJSY1]|uniref:D-alanyl-D-alanine carboxypeptidase family protein n=1 Tax=Clostridium sp. SHJSY1 TaxID=2942483 RepID=UPI0028766B4A|nr:D-alanyl-D-alanine carboxypeptidase family protein [Clostridium sp. SHJSY1]MDS0528386.1 D-alanyl-D-alanine carboxypeptidase [Clostridium sp. SHJSY1]
MNTNRNFLKKLLVFFNIFIILNYTFSSFTVKAANEPTGLSSKGAAVMDATTGQLLFSLNPDTKYFPASTTKILTALVVLENTKLDDKVTVGKKPPFVDGTAIGLKEGEIFTVEELLLGLLMESGNDCAEALAEHVSGSNEEFAKLMNERAKKIGTTNSNFKNPSGLPDPEHYTTPRDLALIMREAIKNPEFIKLCRTDSLQMSPSNLDGTRRWLNNHNSIINPKSSEYYYKYAVASKKGYTTEAHFTNVMSAEKDGHTIIASCLDGETIGPVYSDTTKICDYAFNNFTFEKLYSEGDKVGSYRIDDETEIPLVIDKDVFYTIPNTEKDKLNVSVDYEIPDDIQNKQINIGDVITSGKVIVNGTEISNVDLKSGIDREATTPVKINNFFNKYDLQIKVIVTLIILSLIIFLLVKRKKFSKRKNINKLKF